MYQRNKNNFMRSNYACKTIQISEIPKKKKYNMYITLFHVYVIALPCENNQQTEDICPKM